MTRFAEVFHHEGVALRVVEESDLDELRHLHNEFSTWANLTDPTAVTPVGQKKWFESGKVGLIAYSDYLPFIGYVRFDERDTVNRSVRIGLDVVKDLRGKGNGKRVYRMLLRYFFDFQNCHRVWLQVLSTNERGKALYRKVGFQREGKLRDAVFRDGKWLDYDVMSILEDEYRLLTHPPPKEAT